MKITKHQSLFNYFYPLNNSFKEKKKINKLIISNSYKVYNKRLRLNQAEIKNLNLSVYIINFKSHQKIIEKYFIRNNTNSPYKENKHIVSYSNRFNEKNNSITVSRTISNTKKINYSNKIGHKITFLKENNNYDNSNNIFIKTYSRKILQYPKGMNENSNSINRHNNFTQTNEISPAVRNTANNLSKLSNEKYLYVRKKIFTSKISKTHREILNNSDKKDYDYKTVTNLKNMSDKFDQIYLNNIKTSTNNNINKEILNKPVSTNKNLIKVERRENLQKKTIEIAKSNFEKKETTKRAAKQVNEKPKILNTNKSNITKPKKTVGNKKNDYSEIIKKVKNNIKKKANLNLKKQGTVALSSRGTNSITNNIKNERNDKNIFFTQTLANKIDKNNKIMTDKKKDKINNKCKDKKESSTNYNRVGKHQRNSSSDTTNEIVEDILLLKDVLDNLKNPDLEKIKTYSKNKKEILNYSEKKKNNKNIFKSNILNNYTNIINFNINNKERGSLKTETKGFRKFQKKIATNENNFIDNINVSFNSSSINLNENYFESFL